MQNLYDIIIVGGGPVGSTVASALKISEKKTLLIEEKKISALFGNTRILALSTSSKHVLDSIGAWNNLSDVTPISSINISQKNGFGQANIKAKDNGMSALGYTVKYGDLVQSIFETVKQSSLEILDKTKVHQIQLDTDCVKLNLVNQKSLDLKTRLLVLCNGSSNIVDQTETVHNKIEYKQIAVSCKIATSKPHRGEAFERFGKHGPIALLPYGESYVLVWCCSPEEFQKIRTLKDREFLDAAQKHFGYRAGEFVSVRSRIHFPLELRYTQKTPTQKIVLLGNASQSLHPVAGQGLNLGLRDALELSKLLEETPIAELQKPALVARFNELRSRDRISNIRMTDFLVRFFSIDNPAVSLIRGFGIAAFDILPPLKHFLVQKMSFGFLRNER